MISVIGSGTVGSYAAYQLAKKGFDVNIYEDHDKIGVPCHCTGILTSHINDIIKLPSKLIVNKLDKVMVVSPNKKSVEFKTKDIVVDRIGLDVFFAEKATDAGANLNFLSKFQGFSNDKITLKQGSETKEIKTDMLIGADGPNSSVAKLISEKRLNNWIGVQVVQKGDFEKDTYEVHFGSELCPEFFAWVVPESESSAIIGLATKQTPNIYFERFMRQRCGENWKSKLVSYRGGLIPEYDPKIKTQKGNIFTVGDAAGHVKATTGGGIIPGMRAAEALADSIEQKKNYDSEWRKRVGKDLWTHLKIRQTLNKFSDEDYNFLIELLSQQKTKRIIEEFEREYPSRYMAKMLLKEPRLLYFIKHLF